MGYQLTQLAPRWRIRVEKGDDSMKTMNSRAYTNVILTAIAILLAVAVLAPYASFVFPVQAQRNALSSIGGGQMVANATQQVAQATENIAAAITRSAESQMEIARALKSLAGPAPQ